MFARALLALALLVPAAVAQKIGEFPFSVDQFSGENLYIDGARTPPNSSQEAINVLTEHGYIEKRPGSYEITNFPFAAENTHEFVTISGTRYLLAHASNTIYATDLGSPPTAIATVTLNTSVDFVTAYSKAVFVDGTKEIEWNGTSSTTAQGPASGFPGCAFVEFSQNRVWCGNIAADSASRVKISSFGATSYWTVPASPQLVPDGPNYFDIQRDDGYPITCLKRTPWGMVVGKRRSMWIIKGYDNTNWYVRNVDPNIGCVDDRSMQMVEGRLFWLAVDGIYAWDGAKPVTLESQAIESTIKSLRQAAGVLSNWTVDSQADFQQGLANDGNATWDTTNVPGSVQPTTHTFTDATTDAFSSGTIVRLSTAATNMLQIIDSTNTIIEGTFSTSSTWRCSTTGGGGCAIDLETLTTVSSAAHITRPSGANPEVLISSIGASNVTVACSFSGSATDGACAFPATITSTAVTISFGMCGFGGCTGQAYADVSALVRSTQTAIGHYVVFDWVVAVGGGSAIIDNVRVSSYAASGSLTSRTFDTAVSTPTFNLFTESITSNSISAITFQEQSSSDGSSWGSAATITPGNRPVKKQRYWRYVENFTTTSGSMTATSASVGPVISLGTGTYSSAVHFIGNNITSWRQLNATETNDGGLYYNVRSASYAFTQAATVPAWQSVTNNTTIAIATGSYYQFRIDSSSVTSSTQVESVSRVFTQWQEGTGISAASAYQNHRYFLSVAADSNAIVNDTIEVRQRTGDWVRFTGQSVSALSLFNNDLLGSSSGSDGKVWQMMQNGLYNDDGAAIASSWVTPDYLLSDPVSRKVVSEIWIDAQPSSGTLLSVGYAVDRSTAYLTRSLDLGLSANAINRRAPITAERAVGKYFRMKFSSSANAYFRLNGFTLFGQINPRTD